MIFEIGSFAYESISRYRVGMSPNRTAVLVPWKILIGYQRALSQVPFE